MPEPVTVVIPTYNRAGLLPKALVSVLEQTRPPEQVIVVCDGCTDNSCEVATHLLSEWGYQWPEGRVIKRKENGGKAAAVNQGLWEADGELVWIFDDDDLAHPERLEKVVPLFEQQKGLGLVHTWAEYLEPDGTVEEWRQQDTPIEDTLRNNLRGNLWFTISVCFRKKLLSLLAQAEGIPTWFDRHTDPPKYGCDSMWPMDMRLERAQDYDLWMRLAWVMSKNGWKVKLLPEKTVTAVNHRGKRGIGHRLTFDDIPQKTLDCEKIIFEKMLKQIPLSDIFLGYENNVKVRQQAHCERAFALAVRGLWEEVFIDLVEIDRPDLLRERQHRGLLSILFHWCQENEPGTPVHNMLATILAGIPEEVGPVNVSQVANILL